jgi:hypothetical protein
MSDGMGWGVVGLIDTISSSQHMWMSEPHVLILTFSLISRSSWDEVEVKRENLVCISSTNHFDLSPFPVNLLVYELFTLLWFDFSHIIGTQMEGAGQFTTNNAIRNEK